MALVSASPRCPWDSHKAHEQLRLREVFHTLALQNYAPSTVVILQCQFATEHLSGNAAVDLLGKGHFSVRTRIHTGPVRSCAIRFGVGGTSESLMVSVSHRAWYVHSQSSMENPDITIFMDYHHLLLPASPRVGSPSRSGFVSAQPLS